MADIRHDKKIRKIIIVGASGHAAEIDDYINYYNRIKKEDTLVIEGFIDDNKDSYSNYEFTAPYLGTIKSHKVTTNCVYIIAIASIKYRKSIINLLIDRGAEFKTFIHPSAYISESATIGNGVVIAPNVNIGPKTVLGNFNLVNSRVSIGHDTMIGDYNFITPNVCFSGFTKIGNENMFGINSATIPNISIGSGNVIAAGMVIDKNIKDNTTVFHRFKEKIIILKK